MAVAATSSTSLSATQSDDSIDSGASVSKKKRNMDSFKTYIHRILREQNLVSQISRESIDLLDKLMHEILQTIGTDATKLLNDKNKHKLTEREIKAVLVQAVGVEVAEKVIKKANMALDNFYD